jgi:6-phosphofructokinase 1
MKLKGNLLVLQSGGPTAVINASALGVIGEAFRHPGIKGVWSAHDGILGVLDGRFYDLRRERPRMIRALRYTPASALGSSRHKLKTAEEIGRLLAVLKERNVRYFVYIGGNDSMDTADKLNKLAFAERYEMRVMGVPKTVDNDLFGTDHTPGYGSVIKYLAATVDEVGRDTESLRTHEPVSVIEAMGRNTGWIAAGAALARRSGDDAPHLIVLPEVPFDKSRVMSRIDECLKRRGTCTISVSEGARYGDGSYIAAHAGEFSRDAFGHVQLGGAGIALQEMVEREVRVKARYVLPQLAQRSAGHFASKTDSDEAWLAGREAVRLACAGASGFMTSFRRLSDDPYRVIVDKVELEKTANGEHLFPKEWIASDGLGVTDAFLRYARPLVRGEVNIRIRDGLPDYCRLEKIPVRNSEEAFVPDRTGRGRRRIPIVFNP